MGRVLHALSSDGELFRVGKMYVGLVDPPMLGGPAGIGARGVAGRACATPRWTRQPAGEGGCCGRYPKMACMHARLFGALVTPCRCHLQISWALESWSANSQGSPESHPRSGRHSVRLRGIGSRRPTRRGPGSPAGVGDQGLAGHFVPPRVGSGSGWRRPVGRAGFSLMCVVERRERALLELDASSRWAVVCAPPSSRLRLEVVILEGCFWRARPTLFRIHQKRDGFWGSAGAGFWSRPLRGPRRDERPRAVGQDPANTSNFRLAMVKVCKFLVGELRAICF